MFLQFFNFFDHGFKELGLVGARHGVAKIWCVWIFGGSNFQNLGVSNQHGGFQMFKESEGRIQSHVDQMMVPVLGAFQDAKVACHHFGKGLAHHVTVLLVLSETFWGSSLSSGSSESKVFCGVILIVGTPGTLWVWQDAICVVGCGVL